MTCSKLISPLALALCVVLPAGGALLMPTTASAQTSTVTGTAPYQVRVLSPEQASQDVALLRRALETIHPGLYRRTSKTQIDRAFARLEAAARAPISELELYRHISEELAWVRCNHTKAEQSAAIEAWRRTNPSHLPFRFRLIDGRMIVESSDPAQTALARGTEIVSINGRSVPTLVQRLGAYVPIDGQTPWSRATALANDGDLMGSDFDHFYPYVFGFARTFTLGLREAGSRATTTVTLSPVSFEAWQTLPWQGNGFRSDFATSTSWRMADATTAYLRVGTFVNYRRPVDAHATYAAIFAAIKSAGATRLILDLRDNGGGSSDATVALADHLIQRPYVWQSAVRYKTVRVGDLEQNIETWGDRQAIFSAPMETFAAVANGYDVLPHQSPEALMPRKPASNGFAGPVTILTSPVNASGSTMLIAKLRDEGRVRLVGARAGGSGDGPTAGRIFNVRLPNSGIAVRVPNALNAMQVTRFEADGGVTPDVLVSQTVEDYRAGRDVVLETALREGPARMQAAGNPVSGILTARLTGAWTGTLEYRDYTNNSRVTLPTTLTIAEDADTEMASLAYVYDDGPGKTVRSTSQWRWDASQAIVSKINDDGADLYRVTGPIPSRAVDPLAWTLWGTGTENGEAVEVRETLVLTASTFRQLRETRPKGQGTFQFRHEYRFVRP
jgi:Peptidase family S41